jgi:23S rRNA G2069 N7-methylase RlmK/C1962 C5-methylase RlmI
MSHLSSAAAVRAEVYRVDTATKMVAWAKENPVLENVPPIFYT